MRAGAAGSRRLRYGLLSQRGRALELPKRKLKAGDGVSIVTGFLAGHRGRYSKATRRHVEILMRIFGTERQVKQQRLTASSQLRRQDLTPALHSLLTLTRPKQQPNTIDPAIVCGVFCSTQPKLEER